MHNWIEKTFGTWVGDWYLSLAKQTKAVAFSVVVGFILGVMFIAAR